jgi:hypothetical protein
MDPVWGDRDHRTRWSSPDLLRRGARAEMLNDRNAGCTRESAVVLALPKRTNALVKVIF